MFLMLCRAVMFRFAWFITAHIFSSLFKADCFSTSPCNYIVLGVTTMVTLYASWGFILRNIFVGVALGVCFCFLGFILLFTGDLTWF